MINLLELRSAFGAGGGPEKTILLTPEYLDSKSYHVVIVYLRDKRPLSVSDRPKNPSCRYYEIIEKSKISFRTFFALKKILAQEKIHVIHGHDYKSDFWAFILSRIYGIPVVTTLHAWMDEDWKEKIYTWFDRRWLKYFSHVMTVSRSLYDEALKFGVSPSKLTLIHNGVDTEFFCRRQPPASSQPVEFLIGYLGRINRQKNLKILIHAVASLYKRGMPCVLEIAGEGAEKESLAGLSRELGIEEKVIWSGYMPDPREFLERTDILVLPSWVEGLPNVLLEAMAYSLPCIATRVAGNPELIEDGQSGLLVDPGSQSQLEEKIAYLFQNPQERIRIGINARKRVEEFFDIKKRFELFEHVLEKAVSPKGF